MPFVYDYYICTHDPPPAGQFQSLFPSMGGTNAVFLNSSDFISCMTDAGRASTL